MTDIDMVKINAELGKRIRERRKSMGLSLENLAEMIQRSDRCIQNIESGSNSTTTVTLYKLASALEVSIDYLLGLKESDEI